MRACRVAAATFADRAAVLFYRPAVLDDVRTDMPAHAGEVFGPVVPFADEAEAVALAAGSEHGLSLSILAGDAVRGLALAERVRPASCTSTTRP